MLEEMHCNNERGRGVLEEEMHCNNERGRVVL